MKISSLQKEPYAVILLNQVVRSQTIMNTPRRKLLRRPSILLSMAMEVENTKIQRKKQLHSMISQPKNSKKKLQNFPIMDEDNLEED